jgi:two-component system nitrate/nitrite response regulator NarL
LRVEQNRSLVISTIERSTGASVLIAGAQSLFRETMRAVLEREPDLLVVAEAHEVSEVVRQIDRFPPDVVLFDTDLTRGDVALACATVRSRSPRTQILVIAGEESLAALIEALEAGAIGYLSKECPLAELVEAIRSVSRGEMSIPDRMLTPLISQLLKRRRERTDALTRFSRLTRREREVLACLTDGADNDAIARSLVISPETVRTHIQNILAKLGVHSRLEATVFVRRQGLTTELMPPA